MNLNYCIPIEKMCFRNFDKMVLLFETLRTLIGFCNFVNNPSQPKTQKSHLIDKRSIEGLLLIVKCGIEWHKYPIRVSPEATYTCILYVYLRFLRLIEEYLISLTLPPPPPQTQEAWKTSVYGALT